MKRFITMFMIMILALSTTVTPSFAASAINNDSELEINEIDITSNDLNIELNQPSELLIDKIGGSEDLIQPTALPLVPLLAGLVIRQAVVYIAKTTTKQVVKINAHASSRAVERSISGKMMDDAFSKGTKYVDILSGERIIWYDKGPLGQEYAVLLGKETDVIETVYNQNFITKSKWIKSNWQFKNDIK